MDAGIRLGLVAYGVVHLLIAWLGLQLALGDNEGNADSAGAMRQLAEQPFGEALTWAVAIGMGILVVWRLLEASAGHRELDGKERWRSRAVSLGKAVVYAGVGLSALKVAAGAGSSSRGRSTTARLMDLPAGTLLVGLVGVAIIGYGARHVVRGLTEKFAEHLTGEGRTGETGAVYLALGKAGYTAKGLSIAAVGSLFLYSALSHDPTKSGGLDQALRTVLQQPFGPYLLGAISVGFAAYGLFCFARARHLST
ncbi:hypothetical protein ABIE44_000844 [Marmoricola sp. OAE513]|uniref:DUF1206 domain-containing protein n=1 Tax=Marmoricola sp. OAE513 TaxID=2817894 RepID=UPI001AE7FEC6